MLLLLKKRKRKKRNKRKKRKRRKKKKKKNIMRIGKREMTTISIQKMIITQAGDKHSKAKRNLLRRRRKNLSLK